MYLSGTWQKGANYSRLFAGGNMLKDIGLKRSFLVLFGEYRGNQDKLFGVMDGI